MNYKVLYRKYRPATFDDVVGQRNTIELLKDSIINDKISHAYIFTGPRGTGKTSSAKIFAKAINCLNIKDGEPCNECENCLNFQNSSDIYEIDAASNNGVDQVREIIDNIKLTPAMSKYKVYIIDEVHMLTTSAFNALLLTLEEPPSHVVFILATTDIEDVPITVLSRCQRLDFQKISVKDIVDNLKNIAKKEKIDIDDDALEEIADYADGGMRDALSILDQLSKNNEKITQSMVLDSLGSISNSAINDLVAAIDAKDCEKIIDFVKFTKEHSTDFKTLCKRIIRAVEKVAIDIKLGNYSGNLNYKVCKDMCLEISSMMYKCNVNIDPYINLELILLSYVDNFTPNYFPGNNLDTSSKSWEITENKPNDEKLKNENVNITTEIDEKIEEVEPEVKEEKSPVVEEKISEEDPVTVVDNSELVDIRVNNCFVNANKTYLNDAKEVWTKFITSAKGKKERGYLVDTTIVLASDTNLVIKVDLDATADEINDKLRDIEDALESYSSVKYKLIAVSEELWNKYMQEYKDNLAKKVKYVMREEPSIKDDKKIVEDIFISSKIEIK